MAATPERHGGRRVRGARSASLGRCTLFSVHLVDELVEGVLAISARLAKIDLASLKWQRLSINRHALAVALHGHLSIGKHAEVPGLCCQKRNKVS